MSKYVIKGINEADGESDLALERRRVDTDIPGVEYRRDFGCIGSWEKIRIGSEEGARSIGRPMGHYDTLTLPRMDMLDVDECEDAREEVAKELCRMCDRLSAVPDRILVVGLGNSALTPDAIGPESAARVAATMHLVKSDPSLFVSLECSEICVISPGVGTVSGIETADFVRGIAEVVRPSIVIAVDALAARSPARLGTTIQICDTGIHPGSGMRRSKGALSRDTLGAPVIAIGVPTVINSRMFHSGGGEVRAVKPNEEMFVAPTEISSIVSSAAGIIAGGINQAFGITL